MASPRHLASIDCLPGAMVFSLAGIDYLPGAIEVNPVKCLQGYILYYTLHAESGIPSQRCLCHHRDCQVVRPKQQACLH